MHQLVKSMVNWNIYNDNTMTSDVSYLKNSRSSPYCHDDAGLISIFWMIGMHTVHAKRWDDKIIFCDFLMIPVPSKLVFPLYVTVIIRWHTPSTNLRKQTSGSLTLEQILGNTDVDHTTIEN